MENLYAELVKHNLKKLDKTRRIYYNNFDENKALDEYERTGNQLNGRKKFKV